MAENLEEANLDSVLDGAYKKLDRPGTPSWILPDGDEPSIISLEAAEAIGGAAESISDAAEAMSEGIDTAARLLTLLELDPLTAAINTTNEVISEAIDAILQTGIFMFPITPPLKWSSLLQPFTSEQAVASVASSLIDLRDSERPQAPAMSSYAGVAVLVGANTWHDFQPLIRLLGGLFKDQSKWSRLADVWSSFETRKTVPRKYRQSQGTYPDWTSFRLEEIEAIEDSLLMIKGAVRTVSGGVGNSLQKTMRIIRKRINYLLSIVRQVQAFTEFLATLAQLKAQAVILPLASKTGGAADMVNKVVNGKNLPPFKFCAGFVAVGFGPWEGVLLETVDKFTTLWGVTKADFENIVQAQSDNLSPEVPGGNAPGEA